MNKHTYQVGDKGTTKGGQPYRVIAVDVTDLADDETIVAVVDGEISLYHQDGCYFAENAASHFDLTPPKRTVYMNVLTGQRAAYFDTAAKAEESARRYEAARVRSSRFDGSALLAVAVPVEIPGRA